MPKEAALCFGRYFLAGPQGPLWQEAQVVSLPPKAAAVLWLLASQAGHVVSKATLLDTVWADTTVGEGSLTSCLRTLRRILRDDSKDSRYIATVHRVGYRFVAPVTVSGPLPTVQVSDFPVRPPPDGPPPPTSSYVVGREAELAQLHTCFAHVRHGRRQIVFVTGDAGIGKTTLVEAFVHQLGTEVGLWVGRGQCIEHYGTGEAYLPVLEALGRLGQLADGASVVACLHQYAPLWLMHLPALLPLETRATVQPQSQGMTRERLVRELAEALEALSAERPVLLALEDLHWSDPSTVEAITLLARRRETARLLVLGTYRPADLIIHNHPLKRVKQELMMHGHCTEVPLGGLRREAVAAYLAQRQAVLEGREDVAAFVYRRTEGHPFFMVQVVDYLEQQGFPPLSALPAVGGMGGLRCALEVPQGLRELIEAQVEQLESTEQEVVQIGSVVGAEFAVASVAATLPASQDIAEGVCERLARCGQFLEDRGLTEWPDGTVSGRYGFRHALYQEVIYTRMGEGRRVQVHRRIGERLEQAYGARAHEVAAELAMHFERGRDYQHAIRYLQQAAENALRRYAYAEATAHCTRGLEVLQSLPDTPERTRLELALQLAMGQALFAIKGQGAPEVAQAYQRARTLVQQVEETTQLGPVLVGLRMWYSARAEFPVAHELSERLLHLAQHVQEPGLLLEAHRSMGVTWFFQGALARARTHLEQGIALATASPAPVPPGNRLTSAPWMPPLVGCHVYAALVLWVLGAADQALQRGQEALTWAQRLVQPVSEATVRYLLSILHMFRGEGLAAQLQAESSLRLLSEHNVADRAAQPRIQRTAALVLQGQTAAGIAELSAGLAATRAIGDVVLLPYFLSLLAVAYGHAGQPHAGLQVLAGAHALVKQSGERWWQAELHRLQGEFLLRQAVPDTTQVAACFQQALAVARRQEAKSLELRAAMSLSRLWQQRKRTEAYDLLAPVYGSFTEGFDTADLQEAKVLLDELAG